LRKKEFTHIELNPSLPWAAPHTPPQGALKTEVKCGKISESQSQPPKTSQLKTSSVSKGEKISESEIPLQPPQTSSETDPPKTSSTSQPETSSQLLLKPMDAQLSDQTLISSTPILVTDQLNVEIVVDGAG